METRKEKMTHNMTIISGIKQELHKYCVHLTQGSSIYIGKLKCKAIKPEEILLPGDASVRCCKGTNCPAFEERTVESHMNFLETRVFDDKDEPYREEYEEEKRLQSFKLRTSDAYEAARNISQEKIEELYAMDYGDENERPPYSSWVSDEDKFYREQFQKYPCESRFNALLFILKRSGNKYAENLPYITLAEIERQREEQKEELIKEISERIQICL